jgi:hypothetical protein
MNSNQGKQDVSISIADIQQALNYISWKQKLNWAVPYLFILGASSIFVSLVILDFSAPVRFVIGLLGTLSIIIALDELFVREPVIFLINSILCFIFSAGALTWGVVDLLAVRSPMQISLYFPVLIILSFVLAMHNLKSYRYYLDAAPETPDPDALEDADKLVHYINKGVRLGDGRIFHIYAPSQIWRGILLEDRVVLYFPFGNRDLTPSNYLVLTPSQFK